MRDTNDFSTGVNRELRESLVGVPPVARPSLPVRARNTPVPPASPPGAFFSRRP